VVSAISYFLSCRGDRLGPLPHRIGDFADEANPKTEIRSW